MQDDGWGDPASCPMRNPFLIELVSNLIRGLLGLGTGIFLLLSLMEKSVWRLMRNTRAKQVSDIDVREIHAILKRVVHLLPPTMITTMSAVTLRVIVQANAMRNSRSSLIVAGIFLVQRSLIALRLRKDICGVEEVPSDGDIVLVRDGLTASTLFHHRDCS